jgi:UDP-glucose 4-epimerase
MGSVLVTGATGFIGRATAVALGRAGWSVTRAGRPPAGPSTPATGVVHLDLSDPRTILEMGETARFDAIVHLGARIGWSTETAADLFAPNVLATGCLGHLAARWGAHVVYASAAMVHGVRKETISSADPMCPDTPYGASKWLGEQLLSGSQASHCSLRIGGVFGSGGPTHLGFNRAIAGAQRGEVPVCVGSGKALRNYIYVEDVAAAIVFALQERIKGPHLLAGGEILPVSTMLQTVCDVFLPGHLPVHKDGAEALDQVVRSSAVFPPTRSLREALMDVREGNAG